MRDIAAWILLAIAFGLIGLGMVLAIFGRDGVAVPITVCAGGAFGIGALAFFSVPRAPKDDSPRLRKFKPEE